MQETQKVKVHPVPLNLKIQAFLTLLQPLPQQHWAIVHHAPQPHHNKSQLFLVDPWVLRLSHFLRPLPHSQLHSHHRIFFLCHHLLQRCLHCHHYHPQLKRPRCRCRSQCQWYQQRVRNWFRWCRQVARPSFQMQLGWQCKQCRHLMTPHPQVWPVPALAA